jgi:hypothetical protein
MAPVGGGDEPADPAAADTPDRLEGVGTESPEAARRLLARFEPVLAFTSGELFTPVNAERFVAAAALWRSPPGGPAEVVVPAGELTTDRLVAEAAGPAGRHLQLRFVERPLRGREYRRWHARPDRPRLQSRGRFTKVGLLARFIDALFRVGLLLRGRIPGGFAAAAEARSRQVFGAHPPAYHGRVVHDGGYVVLQYWFFYVMNDWRSTFAGVNDHEGDWELVTVYLARDGEGWAPRWVAMSCHDEHGDDLRRRWDDPDLTLVGEHPVVNVGAGSHAGAVLPGDYVVSVDPPVIRPVVAALRWVVGARSGPGRGLGLGLRIPYVDYARGDGLRVGPGQAVAWEQVLIDDTTPWVRDFPGLWGLDTGDRFGGERAPGGPRYDRSGRIRRSWADPLGWAGLHKVPADGAEAGALLADQAERLDDEIRALDQAIPEQRRALRRLGLSLRSTGGSPRDRRVAEAERQLAAEVERRAELAHQRRQVDLARERGLPAEGPHAHLRHRRLPWATERSERDRFLRVWATLSSPLLIAALVVLLLRPPGPFLTALGAVLLAFFAIEAVARKRALVFVRVVVVTAAALVATVTLTAVALAHWRVTASVLLGLAAVALLVLNISDLRRR